jgi:CHAP domain
MKGAHLRRTPLRSKHEFLIFLFGLCLFGIGIGLMAADAHPDGRVSSITPQTTTTTVLIEQPVATGSSTDVTDTTVVIRARKRTVLTPVAAHSAPSTVPSSTTTTTEAPKTPLEVALKYLGQTGPWAEGGMYCAKFVSYVAEEAKVPSFIARSMPSDLYADALRDGRLAQAPAVGDMIFIDLFGPDGIGHGQVTHVGIVESINGDEISIIQGNGEPDPSVITRTTYHLGDGYIVGFAPFEAAS